MKKNLKSLMAVLMALVMCVSLCAGLSVSAEDEAVTEIQILNDEAGENFSGFSATISQDKVKVGSNAYKCVTANPTTISESWFFRCNPSKNTTLDISPVVEGGAVRFWIYVEDIATVHNWGGSQVQLGDAWDKNVYKWFNWHTQIVNNGWNEIILPFADGGTKTVDTTNVTWFFIKMQATKYATTVYIDNVRATADCVPEYDEVVLATAEWSTEISNTGFCAVPSDEQAAVGKYSYKSWPGTGNADFWVIRGNLAATDLSGVTQNATAGALRFKIWVEDITTLENWNGSQVQLGSGDWDKNVYKWGKDFRAQIINNGWNDIVLPFAESTTIGTPDITAVTYMFIRTNNSKYATTLYVDDIRVTPAAEARADIAVLNEEIGETAFTDCNTSISTEQAKVGSKSYKSTTDGGFWILRSSGSPGGLARSYDISALTNSGTSGALRFWIYVEDISEIANWGSLSNCQVQYGYFWDNNSFKWSSWPTQITKNGWNEIVLPFASAGKAGTPDPTAMSYFFIKIGVASGSTIYVDDIRVTASAADTEDVKLVNEEQSVTPGGTDFCASVSSEQAYEGSNSYKCLPGVPGGSDNWVLRGNLPRAYDLSELSLNGTSGALRFSVYVEDITTKDSWYNESNKIFIQASLGTGMWENYFAWNFADQITKSGWNEVVLPLADSWTVGTVSADNITYFWIRVGNSSCAATLYVDDVRFESRKLGDVNADYYTDADDIAAIRKALLGITEADSFADVNESGALDIADLIRLKKNTAA